MRERRFGPGVLREGSTFELRLFVEQCEAEPRFLDERWRDARDDARRFLRMIRGAGEAVYTTATNNFEKG